MDIDKVISALNSELRRYILRILSKYRSFPSNALTLRDIMFEIGDNPSLSDKYRESVYKALQVLVDAGLIEKFHQGGRGICYKVLRDKLVIDLTEETIS